MSYYYPEPKRSQKRLPRRRPIKVVPSAIGDEGIVGNWLMYYVKGGDHLHDFSPNNNHGVINGAEWVSTKRGWALLFDGVNDYVSLGTGTFSPSTLTLTAWFKTPDEPNGITVELGGRVRMGVGDIKKEGLSAGVPRFYIFDGDDYQYVEAGSRFDDGNWHHQVATYDGSDLKLYIDGSLVDTQAQGSPEYDLTRDQRIGFLFADNHPFNGRIDEVRIYNRVLSI